MTELSKRLTYARELPRHLRELETLLGRPVEKSELLSLDETAALAARLKQVVRQPVMKFGVPFEAKAEPRFATFMARLADANPIGVYVWTPASNLCGLLRPVPLASVRITFPFELSPDGIVEMVTSDLRDELLLDYSHTDEGEWLEVEVSGEHWGRIDY